MSRIRIPNVIEQMDAAERISRTAAALAAGPAPKCKQCRCPGTYIRTRNGERGPFRVWMCDNEHCTDYRLYFYSDHV